MRSPFLRPVILFVASILGLVLWNILEPSYAGISLTGNLTQFALVTVSTIGAVVNLAWLLVLATRTLLGRSRRKTPS